MLITAEIGTTGKYETIELTGDEDYDLLIAVNLEHSSMCHSGCDIGAAAKQGFGKVAAYLLKGATEAPLLAAVIKHYNTDFGMDRFSQWTEWCMWHEEHGRECPECESVSFDTNRCANCGAFIPATDIEAEYIAEGNDPAFIEVEQMKLL